MGKQVREIGVHSTKKFRDWERRLDNVEQRTLYKGLWFNVGNIKWVGQDK